jgi:hypothetical protein
MKKYFLTKRQSKDIIVMQIYTTKDFPQNAHASEFQQSTKPDLPYIAFVAHLPSYKVVWQ